MKKKEFLLYKVVVILAVATIGFTGCKNTEVSGYITEEKVEIARRHLVPKELEANGIKKEYVKFSKAALECIVG